MIKKFAVLLSLVLLTSCSQDPERANSAGTPVTSTRPSTISVNVFPSVMLMDLKTSAKVSTKELLGKPHIFSFWASWCSTCRTEYPILQNKALSKNIIGINVQDASASKSLQESAQRLMDTNHITIPNYVDVDEALTKALGIIGLPVTLVVDSKGNIVDRHDGPITQSQLMSFNNEMGSK